MDAQTAQESPPRPLLLFDGDCGLCARAVQFVLAHERTTRLHFAPLQSEVGREVLLAHGLDPETLSTLVLVDEEERVTLRSSAALGLCRDLRWPWRWARVFLIVPRFLRDGVYRLVAKNRMRFFGSADTCHLPKAGEAARFLG